MDLTIIFTQHKQDGQFDQTAQTWSADFLLIFDKVIADEQRSGFSTPVLSKMTETNSESALTRWYSF
jgi:hypothetical protein